MSSSSAKFLAGGDTHTADSHHMCPQRTTLSYEHNVINQKGEVQCAVCMQIMRGVHENMLDVPYMDQDLGRTVAMCDWMCDYDVCNTKIFSKQHFSLIPLLPVSTLAASNLCQSAHAFILGTVCMARCSATLHNVLSVFLLTPCPVLGCVSIRFLL